jgi:hypothetical protein
MGYVLRLTGIIFTVCVAMALAQAQAPQKEEDVPTILSRMAIAQQQNAARSRAFTVTRDYQLLDKGNEPKAQIVAEITFVPPNQKQYQIQSSHGGLGEKVLRDILNRETEMPKDPQRKALTTENYDFQLLGREAVDGRQCFVLGLKPKREDKELIRGKAWVDAETYNVRRVEGNPAKSPSWWIHDIYVLMTFAEVDGMWLRTFTHAVANVRFKGRYEMVSRDLDYRPAQQASAQRRSNRRQAMLAGAALNP